MDKIPACNKFWYMKTMSTSSLRPWRRLFQRKTNNISEAVLEKRLLVYAFFFAVINNGIDMIEMAQSSFM